MKVILQQDVKGQGKRGSSSTYPTDTPVIFYFPASWR